MKNVQRVLIRILLLFILTLSFSIFAGVGVVQAISQEQTGWDVVYDSANGNRGKIYQGNLWYNQMSLATRSNGYPGIAASNSNSTDGSTSGLIYMQCTSGDCASGNGSGYENWSASTQIVNIGSQEANNPSLSFDVNNNPTIAYTTGGNALKVAKYTPGSGSGCDNSDWTCFTITNNASRPIIIIDENNNHFIAYKKPGLEGTGFAYCDDGSVSGCDQVSDYLYYDIRQSQNPGGIGMDIDSNGILHLAVFEGANLRYLSCDFSSTGCDVLGDWSSPYTLGSFILSRGDCDIKAVAGILGIAFHGSDGSLNYAEYSGGNWTPATISIPGALTYTAYGLRSTFAMDISSSGERGIVFTDSTTNDVHYASCESGCTTGTSWAVDPIFVDSADTNNPGKYPSIEFGSGPRIAFGENPSTGMRDIFYAEQEGDEPPEEQIIPELPQSGIWKIVIAVLAFGLVIGMVAWRNKNKD